MAFYGAQFFLRLPNYRFIATVPLSLDPARGGQVLLILRLHSNEMLSIFFQAVRFFTHTPAA